MPWNLFCMYRKYVQYTAQSHLNLTGPFTENWNWYFFRTKLSIAVAVQRCRWQLFNYLRWLFIRVFLMIYLFLRYRLNIWICGKLSLGIHFKPITFLALRCLIILYCSILIILYCSIPSCCTLSKNRFQFSKLTI